MAINIEKLSIIDDSQIVSSATISESQQWGQTNGISFVVFFVGVHEWSFMYDTNKPSGGLKQADLLVNSQWSSHAMWRHRYGSALAQMMACCVAAPSTRSNVDLPFVKFCNIHMRAISPRVPILHNELGKYKYYFHICQGSVSLRGIHKIISFCRSLSSVRPVSARKT